MRSRIAFQSLAIGSAMCVIPLNTVMAAMVFCSNLPCLSSV
jgi:hypothetical protein